MRNLKLFIITILCLSFSNSSLYSQKDNQERLWGGSHKYSTQEAWKLVKHQFPNNYYGYFDQGIGSFNEYLYNLDYETGTVMAGTLREDINDVVYYPSGPCAVDGRHTSTHFWDGDEQDDYLWTIFDCTYRQALQKFFSYWHLRAIPDNYAFIILGKSPFFKVSLNGSNQFILIYITVPDGCNLAQAIKNPSLVMVNKYVNENGQTQLVNQPIDDFFTYTATATSDYTVAVKKALWEILGRMCHLLQDMSVPAHAKNDIHSGDEPYEKVLEYRFLGVNFLTAYQQGGVIKLNKLCNPLRTIFYIQNQIADRFPTEDYVGDVNLPNILGGTTQGNDYYYIQGELDKVYQQKLNNVPFYWPGGFMDTVLLFNPFREYSYVYSFRSVAGLLWYVYCHYYDIQFPNPIFAQNPVVQNPAMIRPGMQGGITVKLQSNLNPLDFDWVWMEMNSAYKPQGVTCQVNNNNLYINWGSIDNMINFFNREKGNNDPPWYFKVFVSGNCGSTIYKEVFPVLVNGTLGCPWVFVQSQDSNIIPENNLLHKSLLPENYGNEIKDKYILKLNPGIFDGKLKLMLVETKNDSSILNRVKLYAIDHHVSKKIAITEDNTIVTYDSSSVIDNIYSTLFDPEYNLTEITEDILFHKEPKNNILGDTLYNLYSEFKYNSGQNPSIIANVKRNQAYPITNKDSYTGIIIGHTPNGSFQNQFIRRENPDNFIFPIGTRNFYGSVDSAHISWDKSFDIRYLAVASVSYSGYTLTELPLSLAYHTLDGDITNNLNYVDSLTSYISENHYLNLEFQNIENYSNEGIVREYIIEVDGKVLQAGSQRMSLMNKVKENNQIPKLFSLSQNYPNPFNPVTNIKYQIPINTFVTVKVYDILGKEVKTLVNEFKSVGNYSVLFDASSLSSGIYFYKMSAGEFSDVKRMVLVK